MKVSLAHVCIETTDLEKTESFYSLLGIRRQFDFRNKQGELVGYYLTFDNRSFIEVIKVREAKQNGVIRHFAMEVDDVDDARRHLENGGVDVTEKEYAGDNNWMITCHDPNGIFIELQQYSGDSMQLRGGTCEVDYRP